MRIEKQSAERIENHVGHQPIVAKVPFWHVSSFCFFLLHPRLSRLMGRKEGMEFSPDSRWVGPNHSRAPIPIREVAQFEASQQHSSNSPRWSQSRAVEEFSQCRHESPQYPGSSGGVGRRRNKCTGRAPGGAATSAFGTILPKSRHQWRKLG